MNEPTELQKAVDRLDHELTIYPSTPDEQLSFENDIRVVLYAAKQLSTLQALSDLHRDEFIRIRAIATDTEIQGLCDRAVTQIEQHVPLIVQRDSAVEQAFALREANDAMRINLEETTLKSNQFLSERNSLTAALKECAEMLNQAQRFTVGEMRELINKALSNSLVQKLLKS